MSVASLVYKEKGKPVEMLVGSNFGKKGELSLKHKPVFTFDASSFKETYQTSGVYDLYDFFESSSVKLNKVIDCVRFLIEEGYVFGGRYSETAKAHEIIKQADLKDRRLYAIPEEIYQLANLVFFGGRTENNYYEYSAKALAHYDLSSAYGYALTLPLPDWKEVRIYKNLSIKDIRELEEEGYFGVAFGEFEDEDEELPVLPVRAEVLGEEYVFFPYGRKRGTFTTTEISLLEKGSITKAILFKRREYPTLREEVLKLYQEKENAKEEWLKAIRKGDVVKTFGLLAKKDAPPMGDGFRKFNRLVGAFITAFIRKELHKALKTAKKYGEVLYWDTDGFLIDLRDGEGLERELKVGKGIGRWNLKTFYGQARFECGGAKQYAIFKDDFVEIKWKGVRLFDAIVEKVCPIRGEIKLRRKDYWLGMKVEEYLSTPVPKRRERRAFSVEDLESLGYNNDNTLRR